MASGLVCRANRPNTWLHRPACKREEKPCQLGAVHTWHKADMPIASVDGRTVFGYPPVETSAVPAVGTSIQNDSGLSGGLASQSVAG
jgi:hypothetical protein